VLAVYDKKILYDTIGLGASGWLGFGIYIDIDWRWKLVDCSTIQLEKYCATSFWNTARSLVPLHLLLISRVPFASRSSMDILAELADAGLILHTENMSIFSIELLEYERSKR
jgi:hypothetical protein